MLDSDRKAVDRKAAAHQEGQVSRMPCARRFSFGVFAIAPLVMWIIGTAIRLTVRDRWPLVATVFYATPPPILISLLLLAAFRILRSGRLKTGRWLLAAAGIQSTVWGVTVFQGEQPVPPRDSLRVAFWNVSRGDFGYEKVAREIVGLNADIVAMTEAVERGQSADFWRSACPEYAPVILSSGMALLVRGTARMIEHDRAGQVCRWRVAEVTVRGRKLNVAVVDFTSNPLMFRQPGFEALENLLERYRDTPLILAGDFNTPVDSACFDRLRRHGANAFETAGEGYRETWPVFLPLLKLDQIWGNSRIHWERCRQFWSLRSDHRPVVAEFRVTSSQPAPALDPKDR